VAGSRFSRAGKIAVSLSGNRKDFPAREKQAPDRLAIR
jgi:hypothetical protein